MIMESKKFHLFDKSKDNIKTKIMPEKTYENVTDSNYI